MIIRGDNSPFSTVIREGWTPPGKIFWIRACRWFVKFDSLNFDAFKFCKNIFIMFMLINFILYKKIGDYSTQKKVNC